MENAVNTYYYCAQVEGNFFELASCLVAAVQEANRTQKETTVYRLLEYTDGQEHIHLATIQPGDRK